VAEDGGLCDWTDFLLPTGDYSVTILEEQARVRGLHLDGPAVGGELSECETIVDVPEGSVFCLTDSRHVQPSLGALLTAATVSAELDGALAKVVTPSWLGTAALMVGPTAYALHGLWTAEWRHGNHLASTLALQVVEE
jgi:hypothetical protein